MMQTTGVFNRHDKLENVYCERLKPEQSRVCRESGQHWSTNSAAEGGCLVSARTWEQAGVNDDLSLFHV